MSEDPKSKRGDRSILMIDDDVELCHLMVSLLEANGYRLDTANDGSVGLAKALRSKYDLVLLDIMMPVLDGFHVLQHLRRRTSTPIILLTARSAREDRISGLESGADYYVSKPFDPEELLATLRAVLRRTGEMHESRSPFIQVGNIKLNSDTREVWKDKVPIILTSMEFDILDMLIRSTGRIVSRDELSTVLNHRKSTPFEHALEVHVSHLRKKLETDDRILIRTVRGVGYLFAPAGQS